jgi:hypothetical protein
MTPRKVGERGGFVEYDIANRWLVWTDEGDDGASEIVAENVSVWFGPRLVAALAPGANQLNVDRLAQALTECAPGRPGIHAEAEAIAFEYGRIKPALEMGG